VAEVKAEFVVGGCLFGNVYQEVPIVTFEVDSRLASVLMDIHKVAVQEIQLRKFI
jgi:hypothetical protein